MNFSINIDILLNLNFHLMAKKLAVLVIVLAVTVRSLGYNEQIENIIRIKLKNDYYKISSLKSIIK